MSHAVKRVAFRIAWLITSRFLLAPSPIEPKIGVVLRLPDGGVAVAKQQLKTRVAKLVVATDIHQRRRSGLRGRQSFRALSLIHISEPTRQAEISYAVFCLKKKKQ